LIRVLESFLLCIPFHVLFIHPPVAESPFASYLFS
jgi:hypothetical protein